MIHITNAGALEAATGGLSHARIGYENLARDVAGIAASTETLGFEADNAQRPDTYSYWKPTALPAWWSADLGSAHSVDYVGVAAHNLGSLLATVKAEYSADGIAWLPASDAASPSDDAALVLHFPPVSARHWRLYITGSALPSLGSIYLGRMLVAQRRIYGGHAPITLARDSVLRNSLSVGGQFLSQSFRRNGYVGAAALRHLTPSWYRSDFDPFVESARKFPYFFAWRPADFPQEVAYAWTDEDIRPSNMGLQALMQVSWQMRAHSG